MSLHVDLIYPGEQRSGAVFTVKSAGRIAAVTVPVVAAMLIGIMIVRNMQSASALTILETHWELTEARQKAANQLTKDLNRNRKILTELETWNRAALPWASQLYALGEATPPSIQLRQISALTRAAEPRTRRFTMRLIGSTRAAQASDAIAMLRGAFSDHAAWAERVDTATVMRFGQDESPGADSQDRIFEIEVVYHPLGTK